MTTDENDAGWDSLAEELGVEAEKPVPKAEKPAAPARPAPMRPAAAPRPEPEDDAGDFGAGFDDVPAPRGGALFDPGPDEVAAESDDFDDAAPEPLDDDIDEAEPAEPVSAEEGQEEGKRKRRRRRRRKKKGGPEGVPAGVPDVADEIGDDGDEEAVAEDVVEEGEAPAEIESDEDEDEEAVPHSAVDEEMEAEAAGPRPEWHVMTWAELVSKLYRPN